MSRLGHGRLGLAAPLRPFAEFIEESAGDKRILLEAGGAREVSGWAAHSSDTYLTTFSSFYFDGVPLDIVSVKTPLERLRHVETVAQCDATPGTYFYDPDVIVGGTWDDGGVWDDGGLWDDAPLLYIHLSDGSSPVDTNVIVELGSYFATAAAIHPALSDDLLDEAGDFESWTDPDTPVDWSVTESGTGWAVSREDIDIRAGLYALTVTVGSAAGSGSVYLDGLDLQPGKLYRLSGEYICLAPSTAEPFIAVSDTGTDSQVVLEDGRSYGSTGPALPGQVEWRRFAFDFVARGGSRLRLGGRGSGSGTIRFDRVRLQRIWRYVTYEPRIAAAAVPVTETGSNDIFFGGKRIGSGSVSLLSPDGRLEQLFAQLDWIGREVKIWAGGVFADGQEILFDDCRRAFTGIIQSLKVSAGRIHIDLQDARVLFSATLPPRIYDDRQFGSMDLRLQGKVRPLWFGSKNNVSPSRIDYAGNGYGLYELADCTSAPNGIKAIDRVWAYTNDTAADAQRSDLRVLLSTGTDYTADLAAGRLSLIKDAKVILIDEDNRRLDFSDGTTLVATIVPGVYIPRTFAEAVETAMDAVSSGITVAYDDATHKYTLTKSAGTFQLLINTGANKDIAPWGLLGFDRGTNRTGSLSYVSNNATFTDADKEHVLRIDGRGYKDDAGGTYSGTANGVIETGEAILRLIAARYMPPVTIDEPSFNFARQRAPEALGIYLKEPTSTKTILDMLEFSNIANIVLDGEGRLFYLVYVGDVPSGIAEFSDSDYLDFSADEGVTDVYSTIKVLFNQDPSSGAWSARAAQDAATFLRFGRPDPREFQTYLVSDDNAQAAASRMLELARRPARKVSFSAKSKLIDKKVGDKIRLTRSRALDPNGSLAGAVMRIISTRQDYQRSQVSVECVDDIVTVAGFACTEECQASCESSCQIGCETACQSLCEGTCQGACQTGCQGACQVGCQATCELASQECATSCQTTCQVTCQSACQQHCQGACQTACQSTCELHCQTTCQTACQTTCELNCQATCQLGCQSVCQGDCQTVNQNL